MPHSKRSRITGRRRFLKVVGAAGISSALGGATFALAQTKPGSRPVKPLPKREPVAPAKDEDKKPPELSEEALFLAGIIERRYGSHLNSQQLEAVTREIDNRLQGGKKLRETKLANHEEPDFTFRA